MAVLLTGGTGKTSVRIGRLLQYAKIPFLLASRRGESAAPAGMPATKFDWVDASTYKNAFEHEFAGGETISAVYLVAPEVADPAPHLNAFIDYAIKHHGVKRFVLIGGSSSEIGGHHIGKTWSHLLDIGVDYCVLRPTWFMENFSEAGHRFTIKGESKIYTSCEDGKIPFVSANDIAAVAFRALTDEKSHNTDRRILGPELLTYDQLTAKLGNCLGREVVHVRLGAEERTKQLQGLGLSEYYAKFLTHLETAASTGFEERVNDAVEEVTGMPPQSFDDFAEKNKAVWV